MRSARGGGRPANRTVDDRVPAPSERRQTSSEISRLRWTLRGAQVWSSYSAHKAVTGRVGSSIHTTSSCLAAVPFPSFRSFSVFKSHSHPLAVPPLPFLTPRSSCVTQWQYSVWHLSCKTNNSRDVIGDIQRWLDFLNANDTPNQRSIQHTPFAICAQNTAKQLLTAELLQLTWISHSLTDRQVAEHILCDCVVFDFFFYQSCLSGCEIN